MSFYHRRSESELIASVAKEVAAAAIPESQVEEGEDLADELGLLDLMCPVHRKRLEYIHMTADELGEMEFSASYCCPLLADAVDEVLANIPDAMYSFRGFTCA
jgi:hypothetical protein